MELISLAPKGPRAVAKERKGKERGGKGAVGGVRLRISFSFSFFWLGAIDSIHYCRCLWLTSDLSSLSSRRNAEICRWDTASTARTSLLPLCRCQFSTDGSKYRAFIMTSICNIAGAGDVVRNERGRCGRLQVVFLCLAPWPGTSKRLRQNLSPCTQHSL